LNGIQEVISSILFISTKNFQGFCLGKSLFLCAIKRHT
jgi:hypothetical protein